MITNVKCPLCGGQKSTQIGPNEYRCEYCGQPFSPEVQKPVYQQAPPPQPTYQQAPPQQVEYRQPAPQPQYSNQPVATNSKNRIVAVLLAVFLGNFGIHQFYLGNTKKGILYLLFFWSYIPAIIAFIEAIMMLVQSDEEFARKPKLII